jgi:hypothetical protein
MKRVLLGLAAVGMLALASALFTGSQDPEAAQAAGLPPLPANWPQTTFQIGLSDSPGGAVAMKQTAPSGSATSIWPAA